MSQSCWHKGVSMMTWSGVGHNYADEDINKSKNGREMKKGKGNELSLLEGDTWNITTYELVPDLWGDPFVIDYHVP